ncbi:unnamed protein product [Chironomus riparius]|uniref:Uncharacterized protein n=1 Tax=Chironomus riparius TaxID=315576 RepID=A0A9N9RYX4_9DIPT|nr:unnamed protein product [Chironomus riparius]
MVKSSDILKLILVIQFVEFCVALPLNEDVYDSAYDQELNGYVPIASLVAPSNYWQQKAFPTSRYYPSLNERNIKTWLVPSKRNSELINSLLGLPKNMDQIGK